MIFLGLINSVFSLVDKTSGGSMESRPLPPRPDKNKKPVVPNKSALHPHAPKKGPPSPNRGPSLPVPDTKPSQPKSFLHTTDNPTVKELRQKLNEQHIIGATSPNPAPAKNKQVTPFAKEPNNNKGETTLKTWSKPGFRD